jgi:hypothetical protein
VKSAGPWANVQGVKDFSETQELKEMQSFIHFQRKERAATKSYWPRIRSGLGFINI